MKLHPDKQIEVSEKVLARILDLYTISNFTFHLINYGIENTAVYVKSEGYEYVLRIYSYGKRTNDEISFELEFQNYLRKENLPAPFIYPNQEGDELSIISIGGKEWQVILMKYIEGESVTVHPSHDLIRELARMQAAMHIHGISFASISDKRMHPLWELNGSIAKRIEISPVQTKEVLEFIERAKVFQYILNQELPYGYNHLDIDFDGNVIVHENKIVGIIDFDDMAYSPAVVCLGSTLWNIMDDEGINSVKYYLDEYQKIRSLTSLELQTLPYAMMYRNYEIGIIRLLLWKGDTPIEDIMTVIELEKEIPKLGTLWHNENI
jgi:Ser/Thr protein kinase RdoA (MazF antagonist)